MGAANLRNVLIRFAPETKKAILAKASSVMNPYAVLLLRREEDDAESGCLVREGVQRRHRLLSPETMTAATFLSPTVAARYSRPTFLQDSIRRSMGLEK